MSIEIFSMLSSFALALLVISPTIFIFSVTLLGTAIEKSRQEENSAREITATATRSKIQQLEENIKIVKINGDPSPLEKDLEALKFTATATRFEIAKIKIKYECINFKNTVLYPCVAFISVIILGLLGIILHASYKNISYLAIILEILLIIYGIFKIYNSLKLVQEISEGKKESEYFDRIRNTIKLALREYDQNKEEEAQVRFLNATSPLNVLADKEFMINFDLILNKGNMLHETYVYFFVPDEITLIDPPESKTWRQGPNYDPPNTKTIKIDVGNLNIGRASKNLKLSIKTPNSKGKYLLRYRVFADGYNGSAKDFILLVG